MMNVYRQSTALAAVVAAAGLAACAGLASGSPYERIAALPADGGRILFKAAATGDRPARRVAYADNEQRVEYALYEGGGAQAELVYMDRPYDLNVVFNFEFTIADKVATWNYSKSQPIQWRDAVRVRTGLGEVFYRPYALTARNQECFGISGEWDNDSKDGEFRPTRILFGYYCAPPGQPLGDEDIKALVDGVGLRDVAPPAPAYAGIEANRSVAISVHGADGSAGIAEFPFRYAEYYNFARGSSGN